MEVILRGRDHIETGTVEVRLPAADLGLGMTKGRYPKSYAFTDPNEDVVAVVREGPVTALVAADGHSGHEGSHAVVDALLEALEAPLPAALTKRAAVIAFHEANEALRAVRQPLTGDSRRTRSTLVLAMVATAQDGTRTLTTAGVGDSAVFVISQGVARQVTRDRHRFLGDRLSAPEVAGSLDYAVTELESTDIVVAATDGLTNFADREQIGRAVVLGDPGLSARRLIDVAGDGGAGDNVSVVVLDAGRH